jgi:hypothetical protein
MRGRDDRITAFQDHEGATPAGGNVRAGQLVAVRVKQTTEFTLMRRQNARRDDRVFCRRLGSG